MKLLLDTHLLLWSANEPEKLSVDARRLLKDPDNLLYFSAASLWEIVIKNGLGREAFQVDPHLLWRGLLDNGYVELPVTGPHSAGVK
ncbi:MAG: type II toxin-antitoxin system VapC family toxin [Spirochaetales bacterium]